MDTKILFSCKIGDGAVLKYLSEVMNISTNGKYLMKITKNSLCFLRNNLEVKIKSIMITAKLEKSNLIDWVNNFNETKIFEFTASKLHKIIYNTKRSEPITLMMYNEDSICISILRKGSMSNNNVSILDCSPFFNNLEIIDDFSENDEPNFVEQTQNIISSCSTLTRQKCSTINVVAKKSMMILKGIQNNQMTVMHTFGCDTEEIIKKRETVAKSKRFVLIKKDPSELVNLTIEPKILSILSKMAAITPNSSVKFYVKENKPIRVTCHIFVYGTITLYLFDKYQQLKIENSFDESVLKNLPSEDEIEVSTEDIGDFQEIDNDDEEA